MKNTMFEAARSSLRATPSRRQALTALAAGLPGLFLTAGTLETAAKKRKKNQRKRQRRKNRQPDKDPQPDTEACDVCRSGCAFSSVQAAIDAAAPGDTIQLCAGVFAGPIEIQKDLTLIGVGDGEKDTTLDGRRSGTTVIVLDSAVTLERLRITGGVADLAGGGIFGRDSEVTLTACTVSGNAAPNAGGGGIFHQSVVGTLPSGLILNDSTVTDNEARAGGGIFIETTGALILNNSLITGNKAEIQGGGLFGARSGLFLNDSRVENNAAGDKGGGIFSDDSTVTLNSTTVTGNTPDNCVGVDGCA